MKVLTISIAAYNVDKFIKQTLDSLIDERIMDDLEIIVVNDGSSDNTLAIAKEYERKYPDSFIVIDKENGGYGSTINSSLKIASGKYYKLLDGDDWYDKEILIDFINYLKTINSDVVVMPCIEYVDDTNETKQLDALNHVEEKKEFTFEGYPVGARLSQHQVCFKTETIKDKGIKIRENCFYTDTEYLLKCLSKCKTIVKIDLPIYIYRIGLEEQSMSLSGLNRHYRDVVKYYKEMIRYYNEENYSDIFKKKYFEGAMISLAKYHLTNFLLITPCRKKEYIEFEKYIKDNAPSIYEQSNCKTLSILRKTNNIMFRPLSFILKIRAKKKIRV